MDVLRDLPLVQASVPRTATFAEAAEELTSQKIGAIAVLDDEQGVAGLFGGDELLRGLFPGYLADLRHTAFARDDLGLLEQLAARARDEPVHKHMRKAVTIEAETSAIHIAERFLHEDVAAVAVIRDGRFIGMLDREDFGRFLVRREKA